MAATTPGFNGLRDDTDESGSEFTPLYDDDGEDFHERTAQETKGWNLFRDIPVKKESNSMKSTEWIVVSVKFMKVIAFLFAFTVILGSAAIAKGTILFITAQLKKDRAITHCNRNLGLDQQFITVHTLEERITWLWAALIVFSVPEIGIFLRSARLCFFKTVKVPTRAQYIVAFVIDTLHAVGISVLMLIVLPELDAVKAVMMMNAMCFVPGILNALSRDSNDSKYFIKIILDVLAVSAQATAFVVWPLLNDAKTLWATPAACILISVGWWENFVGSHVKNPSALMRYLQEVRDDLKRTRYNAHRSIALWKIFVFLCFILASLYIQGDNPLHFFTKTLDAFSDRLYTVEEVQVLIRDSRDVIEYAVTGESLLVPVNWATSLWVALIQVCSAYVCFAISKFACKILIQNFSFTFALSLAAPVTVILLIYFCGIRNADPCVFQGVIPDYLFFEIPPVYQLREFISGQMAWIWLLWLASQAWVCAHTWRPRCERLAASDKLFAKPWYTGPLIEQSLLMNRTMDDENDIQYEDTKDGDDASISSEIVIKDVKPTDSITRIYACATMWHETKEEMIEFLKSIFRMDEDQSARRVAQKYLGIIDPDYYEFEANIFMDDSFEVSDHSAEDSQVNRYVKCLVDTIDEAASEVHLTNVRLRPAKKYPTPYGGRLVWILPGKNKLICHLKDKSKIRHRKRWSQVMYMYYLLGHRLMDLPISVDRKEVIAENTYLLALDGDVDFKASGVTILIDLMKKDKNLGSACGRIHPVGSGFMAWYQMFEYAIGHWLQKATEHMIGCVLCSPGCFSLFRGKALMDDNVMKRYTLTSSEARHYVQYDQGEDRWLCTLLLQRGYRIEYSAVSDSYTHCPERFEEFFSQRRRWVPSTTANIMDLLTDSKKTIDVNDSVSRLYIVYQSVLMIGTVFGPGTIFLMMVGATNSIAGFSIGNALLYNLIPIIIFFVVCLTCKSEIQLLLANLITCIYAMIMTMVIVSIALQIVEDGWYTPTSMFFIATVGIFFITAALHPQEIKCLLYIVIYYITIPSMYMLLIIYSVCNLNNVTWGTREGTTKKTVKQMEAEKKLAEQAQKKMDTNSIMKWLGTSEEKKGTMEFGIAGLFRCVFCTNPNQSSKEDLYMMKITNSIEKIENKLQALGAPEDGADNPNGRRRSSMGLRRDSLGLLEYEDSEVSTEVPREDRDDLINPYWVEDPDLHKGEVDFLTTAEIEFWKDLIETYLRPIDENKEELERIKTDLKNLRNMIVFAFLMLNSLFVLVIFLLQLNQDTLHIKWPIGQEIRVEYDQAMNIVHIHQDPLKLEPIGALFVVFFGAVLGLQFVAMLLHRLGTLTHMLATTQLNWFGRKPDDISEEALFEKRAVDIAKDLQRLNTDDLERRGIDQAAVSRRKTLHNLERSRDAKHSAFNLDANFKKRLTILQNGDPQRISSRLPSLGGNMSARRATIRALMTRRDSHLAEKRRSHSGRNSVADYHYDPSMSDLSRGGSSAGVYVNKGYEPAFDSDDGVLTPRRSTVRFREHYA